MLIPFSGTSDLPDCDVCVVGAGPVGLALALACEQHGLSVRGLDSGPAQPDRFAAELTAGHAVNRHHAVAKNSVYRGLGGTSRWWGGRCVPFDDIDFEPRAYLPSSGWPIPHAEIAAWYEPAAAFFGIEPSRFSAAAGPWTRFGDIRCDQLERWTPQIDAGKRHRAHIMTSSRLTVVPGATVTELHMTEDCRQIAAMTLADRDRQIRIEPRRVILACGGIETTRLLLRAQQRHPHLFGGPDGALGRGYMGHLSGKIADIVFADPSSVAVHDFFLDHNVFARRRLTISPEAALRDELLNIAFWADNPAFHRPGHRSGVLSLVWLALAVPWVGRLLVAEGVRVNHVGPPPHRWTRHAWNVMRTPLSTALEIATIIRERLLASPPKPGFLTRSGDDHYALHYIAEQSPHEQSRLRLSNRQDALGLPFLDIELHYNESDAHSVLRAHTRLDVSLQRSGLGRLVHHFPLDDRVAEILQQASDGYHQIGTTRMGATARDGVVDADCRTHGIDNLYVASSSVFPTSGQANPTFVAVALALRLAAHLTRQVQDTRLGVAA